MHSAGLRREAMQHAVNVLAETIGNLNLTARQAEIAKAVVRAGIRKLNLDDSWLRGAPELPIPPGPPIGWEPIDTAPKDGTRVLLWADAWEMSWGVQVGQFEDGRWITAEGEVSEDEEWPLGDDEEEEDEPVTLGPTHWQPLPAPPQSSLTATYQDARGEAEEVLGQDRDEPESKANPPQPKATGEAL